MKDYCQRSGFSEAAADAFMKTLREEALATGPAAAAAGGARLGGHVFEARVAEMLQDVPRSVLPASKEASARAP